MGIILQVILKFLKPGKVCSTLCPKSQFDYWNFTKCIWTPNFLHFTKQEAMNVGSFGIFLNKHTQVKNLFEDPRLLYMLIMNYHLVYIIADIWIDKEIKHRLWTRAE